MLKNIESLVKLQNFSQDIEVIYVNDGSTDGSASLLEPYLRTNPNIRLINTSQKGVSAARNEGMSICHGEYITFCDIDDYYKENFIDAVYEVLLSTKKYDILLFGYETRLQNGTLLSTNFPRWDDSSSFVKKVILGHDVGGFVWNKIYRRTFLKESKFDTSLSICEDMHFNIAAYSNNKNVKIHSTEKALYVYTLNPRSSSRTLINLFDSNGNFKYAQAFFKIGLSLPASWLKLLNTKLFMCSVTTLSENIIYNELDYTQKKQLKKISKDMFWPFMFNKEINLKNRIVFLAYFLIPQLKLLREKLKNKGNKKNEGDF